MTYRTWMLMALTIAGVTPVTQAEAFNSRGCTRVPSCHVEWRYVSKPIYRNICQYYGQQRSCYMSTTYQQVPVGTQVCSYSTYCPGGFSGMLRRY